MSSKPMWKAWIGFNARHSLGAKLFGLACYSAGVVAALINHS